MAVQEPSSEEIHMTNLTVKEADDLVKSYNIDDKNIREIWMPTNNEACYTNTYLKHLSYCQEIRKHEWHNIPGGMDHREIIKQFMTNAAKLPVVKNEVMHTYVTPEGKEYKLYTSNDPSSDLLFFINHILQNKDKGVWDLKSDLGILFKKKKYFYDITDQELDSSLTLDRVCQAFAGITAKVIMDEKIKGKLESLFFQSIEIPLIMTHHNILPGLLRETDHELIDIAIYLYIELALKVNDKCYVNRSCSSYKNIILGKLFEYAKSFVYSAIGTNIMDETTKRAFLMKVGLIDESNKLTNAAWEMYLIARQLNALHGKTYNEVISLMVTPTIYYKQEVSPPNNFNE